SFFLGPGGTIAVTDPWVTPAGLLLLVPLALRAPADARPALRWLAALLAAATLPALTLNLPFDVVRFAVAPLTWWLALAAVGAARLPRAARAGAVALVAATAVLAARPVPPTLWDAEYRALRALEDRIPPRATVWFDPEWDQNAIF